MPSILKVSEREKLKPRRDPYWQKQSQGCYVGYRKMAKSAIGTWLARCRNSSTGKQEYESIGELSHLPAHERYDEAVRIANIWFKHLGRGGKNESVTISDVCKRYVEHLRKTKGNLSALDAEARFTRHVLNDKKFAETELTKLTAAQLDTWRKALRNKPIKTGPTKGNARSESAVNRDMTSFRAALNHAYDDGLITSKHSWRTKLSPTPNADKRRDVYLTRDQRKKLVECATRDIADFLRALCYLPIRPGAMASLTVGQYDARLHVLTVGRDKAHAGRKIYLPANTAKFFATLCIGRAHDKHILKNSQGQMWRRDAWGYQFRKAANLAGLPQKASVYSLRHSTITDLISSGVPSLNVAQISGTSVAMIEKHYGHLTQEQSRAALEKLAI